MVEVNVDRRERTKAIARIRKCSTPSPLPTMYRLRVAGKMSKGLGPVALAMERTGESTSKTPVLSGMTTAVAAAIRPM
jgi:hypothetical protein